MEKELTNEELLKFNEIFFKILKNDIKKKQI